ncbi:MAG TPA: DOMON-like domain-containing protein [Allosphingosinicella sp.]
MAQLLLLLLQPHPTSAAEDVHKISVEASRSAGLLRLRFIVEARLDRLAIPPPALPRRCENLWQHSCFEAFVRAEGRENYVELNFAPSGAWAAYEFEGERRGMTEADMEPCRIQTWSDSGRLELSAEVERLPYGEPWRLGLSAVIEHVSGRLSYWALLHPSDEPDFHHPESFILALP